MSHRAPSLWALTAWAALVPARAEETRPPVEAVPVSEAVAAVLGDDERERFLASAEIVDMKTLSVGVTGSRRATLSDGRFTHDAHVQTIDLFRKKMQLKTRVELNFRDSYKFNIAAYRLDRLLGLGMVPVSVERPVGAEPASVTWWVDDVLMSYHERIERGIQPPDVGRWNDQMYQARAFNQLVYNTDPNLGNFLIDRDWKLWLIDYTRAFRAHRRLEETEGLVGIDRRFYEGLKRLSEEDATRELGDHLERAEIRALLARRDRLLEHFDRRIAELGESAVVCDLPGH